MKNILIVFLMFGGLAIMQSCYYDHPPEPLPFECEDVSYSTHIQTIFINSCATNACHDGTKEPDLRKDVAWNELRSGGYINLLSPEESILYRTVEFRENPMPPGGPQISQINRELILCWLSEGALND